MNLDESLNDKQTMNGPFEHTSELSQAIKFAMRRGANWNALPMESKEAMELIASHLAKILSGDHLQPKHWNDIATLARLRGLALDVEPSLREAVEAVQHTRRSHPRIMPRAVDETEHADA